MFASAERTRAEIGFYDDLARAEAMEPELRDNAKNFDGRVTRIGRATIVWFKKPPLGARLRVERCVAAP